MKTKVTKHEWVALTAPVSEYAALASVMVEVRNGFDISPFDKRIGPRIRADQLFEIYLAAARGAEAVDQETSIGITRQDIEITVRSILEVLRAVEAWELRTRVGCERKLLEQLCADLSIV